MLLRGSFIPCVCKYGCAHAHIPVLINTHVHTYAHVCSGTGTCAHLVSRPKTNGKNICKHVKAGQVTYFLKVYK